MIRSMTSYGKATTLVGGAKAITIEIRSLNSKQLDINTRIPMVFREKELELRAEISRVLERGKVDLFIGIENEGETSGYIVNRGLARQYFNEIVELADEWHQPVGDDIISAILRLPDVLKTDREELNEEDWNAVKSALGEALEQADEFRLHEGALLQNDMSQRVILIGNLLTRVEPLEKMRITNLRERFERNQHEFVENSPKLEKFDENRFEQEIFWYLEKLDVTEEKLRLRKHCEYFLETLGSKESNGRKLGFVTQEIGREINTLGSKAYDADIQKIVVQMKDELEKIKEQLGNVL
jgi:uncharacterized protein (TIGR00255 family)